MGFVQMQRWEEQREGQLGESAPRHWKGDVNLLTSVHIWIGLTSPVQKGNYTDAGELIK